MPFLSDKDLLNLEAILESVDKIENYIRGIHNSSAFYDDEKTFDSVLMNFMVIGESVAKLSKELQESHPHIAWSKIKSFRNIIAHNYFGVDAEEVWQLIHSDLLQLRIDVRKILE